MRQRFFAPASIGRSILIGALLGALIAGVFAAGFFLRDLVGVPRVSVFAQNISNPGYPLLDEVQSILDQVYVRQQPSYVQRQYGAVRGMLGTLNDPYTFFIDPPVAASESDVLAGTYGGIGVQLVRSVAGEMLLYPFEGSSAQAAGIEEGDVLLQIDGQDLDVTLPQDTIDQMLRGEVRDGNGVELTVRRARDASILTTFVPFAVVNVPSVVWRTLPDNDHLGYVQIIRFTSRTPEELRTALTELRESNVQALVLDLRNNAGGLLQESITVSDEFIGDGVLVYERDMQGETPYNASAGGLGADLPLVVLVNGGTASGAEIVAGAIQDSGRAPLIGQRTYGKGTVQQIFPLSDGSSLHVTASEWFTPAQQPLEGQGLIPDYVTEPDPDGMDVELIEAVRLLEGILAGSP